MESLLITTVGHFISGILFILLGIFVVSRDPHRLLYWLFAGFAIFAGVFGIDLAIGINLESSPLAYLVWLASMGNFLLIGFFLHFTLRLVNREHAYRWILRMSYTIMILGICFSLLFPHSFLSEVTPKMFTLSYPNAGPLFMLMVLYFFIALLIATYELVRGYRLYENERPRYEYFLLALLLGFGIGLADFFLVFDIPISPMFGMCYALYVMPIAYGIAFEQLLDIRVVARRAVIYSIGIALTAGGLIALVLFNNRIIELYPQIQFWTIPLISGVFAFVLARTFWMQAIEADRLKYEFITVAAHKLRTPLTRIRWMVPHLMTKIEDESVRQDLAQIDIANNRLIELTNSLLEVAHTEDTEHAYVHEPILWQSTVDDIVGRFKMLIKEKHITMRRAVSDGLPTVVGDRRRISSVLEVFVENAVAYTPNAGSITICVDALPRGVKVSVQDTGIGISIQDQEHMFSSFFRTDGAQKTDTEGMGIGLVVAKSIIEHHGGTIGVESEGEGKGSIFWFTLHA